MKKITKKILAVVMVISLLICSSMTLSFSAFAAEKDVIFTDYFGGEYRGDIYYAAPGDKIALDSIIGDEHYTFAVSYSMDYDVVEDVWDDDGEELLYLSAKNNGVALVNVFYGIDDEIVDDYYVLFVVSDGADLGSVSSIEVDDVVVGYDEEVYIHPDVASEKEGVYYCTYYEYDWEAPFELDNNGCCYGYESGSGEATCYVIDAQGDVFTDTFEIEVGEPSFIVRVIEFFAWFFDILLMIVGFVG